MNESMKRSVFHELELRAWKHFLVNHVRVYAKNSMLRVGRKSWWSCIKERIPDNFVDGYGRIREPWLTMIATWLQIYGLTVSESLDVQVDNIIPSATSAILREAKLPNTDLRTLTYGDRGNRDEPKG
jgi:hypothetical protein